MTMDEGEPLWTGEMRGGGGDRPASPDTAPEPLAAICGLGRDIRLQTPGGPREIRTISRGDVIETSDRGPLPVLWIARARLSRELLMRRPDLRPIRIRRGMLGAGLPRRDLVLAAHQRLVLADPALVRLAGVPAALVPASSLLALPGVERLPPNRGWSVFHLLLPFHALMIAEGCLSESLSGASAASLGPDLPVRTDGLPLCREPVSLPALPVEVAAAAVALIEGRQAAGDPPKGAADRPALRDRQGTG